MIAELVTFHAATLVKIDLSECEQFVGDATVAALIQCTRLVELQLQGCHRISEGSLTALVAACPDLVVLALSGCNVSDATLRVLLLDLTPERRIQRRALHTLLLGGCALLTSRSVDALCAAERLQILKLSRCEFVTSDNALRLASALRALRVFDISKCPNLPKPPARPLASSSAPPAASLSNLSSSSANAGAGDSEASVFEQLLRQLLELLPCAVVHA